MNYIIQKTEYQVAAACVVAFVFGLLIRFAQDGISSFLNEKAIDWNGGLYKGNMKDGRHRQSTVTAHFDFLLP